MGLKAQKGPGPFDLVCPIEEFACPVPAILCLSFVMARSNLLSHNDSSYYLYIVRHYLPHIALMQMGLKAGPVKAQCYLKVCLLAAFLMFAVCPAFSGWPRALQQHLRRLPLGARARGLGIHPLWAVGNRCCRQQGWHKDRWVGAVLRGSLGNCQSQAESHGHCVSIAWELWSHVEPCIVKPCSTYLLPSPRLYFIYQRTVGTHGKSKSLCPLS